MTKNELAQILYALRTVFGKKKGDDIFIKLLNSLSS